MNNKIELANPVDITKIKKGIMISLVVVIIYIIYELLVNGLAWIDFFLSILIILMLSYIWDYRQLIRKPKSIEIEGDCLVLYYRFKSKPVMMKLNDIDSIDVSLDGTKINDWIGFDGILTFRADSPVTFFDIYWKSAIVIREQYKSRFGEYPPMREGFIKKQ
jgi:hypothetical protein